MYAWGDAMTSTSLVSSYDYGLEYDNHSGTLV